MKTRSESEIINGWARSDEVLVTIVCITFNQASYIECALNSFLSQVTTFPFEILIHDDASFDGTTEILLEYSRAFPKLIRLIAQKENMYSKGQLLTFDNLWSHVDSEFIAFCEGDDYWIDNFKLEKQIQAITRDVDICFHAALKVAPDGAYIKEMSVYDKSHFDLGDIIPNSGGLIPTSSYFVRTQSLFDLPSWITSLSFTDYFVQIWVARRGGAIYIPETMSAYRTNAIGSLVDMHASADKKLMYCSEMFTALKKLRIELNEQYDDEISLRKFRIFKSHARFFIKRLRFFLTAKLLYMYFFRSDLEI